MVESLAKPSRVTYVRLPCTLVHMPQRVLFCTTALSAYLAYTVLKVWTHYHQVKPQTHRQSNF